MRNVAQVWLILSINIWAQVQPELLLDEKYVNNVLSINYEGAPEVSSWGKEETFSSLIHLKNRLANNHNPVFVFIIDGGDLFEAANLADFMNSPEGRCFRTIVNYLVLDNDTLSESEILKEKVLPDGNMFLMNQQFKVLAHTKIDYYKTTTGPKWWSVIKTFLGKNKRAVEKVSEDLRQGSDRQLIARFDDALKKIKFASFRERREATESMKGMVVKLGFLLIPITNEKDPEASRTTEKLLFANQTRLHFPVSKNIPRWFDFNKQISFLTK
jgi:hypothetical protein